MTTVRFLLAMKQNTAGGGGGAIFGNCTYGGSKRIRASRLYARRPLTLSSLQFFHITNIQAYKNLHPTSQKTHCISITKTNRLMLFRETKMHCVGKT
jgi:hypothetical protein